MLLMLLRPSDRIFSFFKLLKLMMRSMLLELSDSFLSPPCNEFFAHFLIASGTESFGLFDCDSPYDSLAGNEGGDHGVHAVQRREDAVEFHLGGARYLLTAVAFLPLLHRVLHLHTQSSITQHLIT